MKRKWCIIVGIVTVLSVAMAILLPPIIKRMNIIPVAIITSYEGGSVVGSAANNAGILFEEDVSSTFIRTLQINDKWDTAITPKVTAEASAAGVSFFVSSHPSNNALTLINQFKMDTVGLLIVTGSTTEKLTGIDDGILRVVADVTLEQREIARYIRRSSAKKLLVIQDTDNKAYTEPAYREFSSQLGEGYVLSLCKISVKAFHPDQIQKFLTEKADMLYILIGSHQPLIGVIAQQFHLKNPDLPIMVTPWSRSPQILENAGPAANRIILPSHFPSHHTDLAIREFMYRYYTRFGHQTNPRSFGVYMSLELLDLALEAGMRSPHEVKRYLIDHSPHKTSFGMISFDQFGDVTSQFTFITDFRREFAK